jgi:glucokinase
MYSMINVCIGVDIGGSHIKLAAVDRQGQVYSREDVPTLAHGSNPKAIINTIVINTRRFLSNLPASLNVEGFGFCVPCYILGEDWVLSNVTNLPSLEGYPLRPALAEAFGSSISSTYDTNAAGLAEFLWGSGVGFDRMLFIGVGTGISASFFTRDTGMVSYTFNTIGDTGHIIVDPDSNLECACGGHGCLEAVAAAPALCRYAMEAVNDNSSIYLKDVIERNGIISAKDVSEAAWSGDKAAIAILGQVGRYLGIALTSYLHIFLPNLIVMGGGVCQAGEPLLDSVSHTVETMASPWFMKQLHGIVPSRFGQDAGAMGCAGQNYYPEIINKSGFQQ